MLLRVTVRPSCSNIVLKRLNTSNVLHILLAHLPSFLATKYFDEIPTGPDANRSSCVNGQIHCFQTGRLSDRKNQIGRLHMTIGLQTGMQTRCPYRFANRSSCVNGQIHRLQTFRRPDRILAIRQKTRAMCKRSRDRYFMGYFFYIF